MYKSFLFLILSFAFTSFASANMNHNSSGLNSHITFENSLFDFSSVSEISKRRYTAKGVRKRRSVKGKNKARSAKKAKGRAR